MGRWARVCRSVTVWLSGLGGRIIVLLTELFVSAAHFGL